MKNILQLTTFSKNIYTFGGAIRSLEIKKSLERKYNVKTLNIDIIENEDKNKENESCKDFLISIFLPNLESSADIEISKYFENISNKKLLREIKNDLKKFSFDIVLLEQPYLYTLYNLLKKYNFINPNVKLIYSSHNIEKEMTFKSDIEYVDKIEQLSINNSDIQICASPKEKEYIGDNCKLYINGCYENRSSGSTYWKNKFDNDKLNYVFVGSNHIPNNKGINELQKYINFNDNIKIWLVGDCVRNIGYHESFIKLGTMDQQNIDDLIYESNGVILPITCGGGISLKTVQAIVSQKAIIGTDFSFRGLEEYKQINGIFLTKNIGSMVDLMKTKYKKFYNRKCDDLLWKNIFKESIL